MRFIMYLWQSPGWPGLTWDANALAAPWLAGEGGARQSTRNTLVLPA
jgi:hypothetical protein